MSRLDKEALFRQINEKGYQLSSLDDLMRMNKSHKDLLPILLMHLDYVEPLQRHEVTWIRNAAKSAAKKPKSSPDPNRE